MYICIYIHIYYIHTYVAPRYWLVPILALLKQIDIKLIKSTVSSKCEVQVNDILPHNKREKYLFIKSFGNDSNNFLLQC